jgi:hypothetical protein
MKGRQTMKNMIDLQVRGDEIVAIYTGPHQAQIVQLFGTPIIPTAFRASYGLQNAVAEIRRLNPDCVVFCGYGRLECSAEDMANREIRARLTGKDGY